MKNIAKYKDFFTIAAKAKEEEILYLKEIAEYQFDYDVANALFSSDSTFLIQRSKNTGKIRNIFVNNESNLYLVLRAQDMLFSLTPLSAKVIINSSDFPRHRVVIDSSIESFIREGRNVFAKHVKIADPNIRGGDEVVVVNQNNILVGIGKAKISGEEMMEYKRGVAVHVKRGVMSNE
ncbi:MULTISPECIES: PUA domain-containing protein [Sulfolobaceae]|uniref:PUA domain-containing protein n=1 Tax=Sulfolobaceae TaxID=118883 RepID=UPI001E3964D2|nr:MULTISPECIES: PUA domain-containing protein [unclassified Sulfolobus]